MDAVRKEALRLEKIARNYLFVDPAFADLWPHVVDACIVLARSPEGAAASTVNGKLAEMNSAMFWALFDRLLAAAVHVTPPSMRDYYGAETFGKELLALVSREANLRQGITASGPSPISTRSRAAEPDLRAMRDELHVPHKRGRTPVRTW